MPKNIGAAYARAVQNGVVASSKTVATRPQPGDLRIAEIKKAKKNSIEARKNYGNTMRDLTSIFGNIDH